MAKSTVCVWVGGRRCRYGWAIWNFNHLRCSAVRRCAVHVVTRQDSTTEEIKTTAIQRS